MRVSIIFPSLLMTCVSIANADFAPFLDMKTESMEVKVEDHTMDSLRRLQRWNADDVMQLRNLAGPSPTDAPVNPPQPVALPTHPPAIPPSQPPHPVAPAPHFQAHPPHHHPPPPRQKPDSPVKGIKKGGLGKGKGKGLGKGKGFKTTGKNGKGKAGKGKGGSGSGHQQPCFCLPDDPHCPCGHGPTPISLEYALVRDEIGNTARNRNLKMTDIVVMNGKVYEVKDDDKDGNPELVDPPIGLFKSVCTVTSMDSGEALCTYEIYTSTAGTTGRGGVIARGMVSEEVNDAVVTGTAFDFDIFSGGSMKTLSDKLKPILYLQLNLM